MPPARVAVPAGSTIRPPTPGTLAWLAENYDIELPLPETEARSREQTAVDLGTVLRTWWPLAASWLIMGLEGPAISAVVARLADPAINLAAYGGVVFPLALVIEAPIIMLLAASTALSKDRPSYLRMLRFSQTLGIVLTLLHIGAGFTPFYDWVIVSLLDPPPEIVEPARLGLMVIVPWSWAIGYRRFHQGVLIRAGHSLAVGIGTGIRLLADAAVLTAGYLIGSIPGIAVATATIIAGVLVEAAYVRWRVAPVLRELPAEPVDGEPLTLQRLLHFYVPLSLTSLLGLLALPVGSAGLSRMPLALPSLAVWPVVGGLGFLFRSAGFAYNEVVVALLERPGAPAALRRFNMLLATGVTVALALMLLPTLSSFWFGRVTGLPPELAALAQKSLVLALPMPALAVLQSWFQGIILGSRRTRSIGEAVALSLAVSGLILMAGVVWQGAVGIYVGLAAFSVGDLVRTLWLWRRSRAAWSYIEARETAGNGLRQSTRR